MNALPARRSLRAAFLAALSLLLTGPLPGQAHAKTAPPPPADPVHFSLIDQLGPQINRPAINGLDERRRGPILAAALRQVVAEGKLPPVIIINRDLGIPATVPDEPKLPAGTRLVRIYLTEWSQTRLGGIGDTEILCRFYVQVMRDGRVERKLGPFFAQQQYDTVSSSTPQDYWVQYQGAARQAIEQMAAALGLPARR